MKYYGSKNYPYSPKRGVPRKLGHTHSLCPYIIIFFFRRCRNKFILHFSFGSFEIYPFVSFLQTNVKVYDYLLIFIDVFQCCETFMPSTYLYYCMCSTIGNYLCIQLPHSMGWISFRAECILFISASSELRMMPGKQQILSTCSFNR